MKSGQGECEQEMGEGSLFILDSNRVFFNLDIYESAWRVNASAASALVTSCCDGIEFNLKHIPFNSAVDLGIHCTSALRT